MGEEDIDAWCVARRKGDFLSIPTVEVGRCRDQRAAIDGNFDLIPNADFRVRLIKWHRERPAFEEKRERIGLAGLQGRRETLMKVALRLRNVRAFENFTRAADGKFLHVRATGDGAKVVEQCRAKV